MPKGNRSAERSNKRSWINASSDHDNSNDVIEKRKGFYDALKAISAERKNQNPKPKDTASEIPENSPRAEF